MPETPRSKLQSPTHLEVYDLIVQGLSNEEISRQLRLTPRTVKYRISGILETTRHHNRVGLIAAHGQALRGKKALEGLRGLLSGERQAAVYDLLVAGASGPTIAKKLGITTRTVKFHMSAILERTRMVSHARLVAAHWQTTDVPVVMPGRTREIVDRIGRVLDSFLDQARRDRDRISSEIKALENAIEALET